MALPQFNPIQTAFNGGEVSGRMSGRVDLELYKRALAYCENFEPKPQGSLLMRAGSEHVTQLTGDNRTRLLQFRMTSGQDYLVELLDHRMRLYALDGNTATAQFVIRSQFLQNGDFSLAYGAGWQVWSDSNPAWRDAATLLVLPDAAPFYSSGGDPSTAPDHGPADWCAFGTGSGARAIVQKVTIPVASSIDVGFMVARYINAPGGGASNVRIDISTVQNNAGVNGDIYHHDFGSPAAGAAQSAVGVAVVPAGDYWVMIGTDYGGGHGPDVDNITLYANALNTSFDIVTPWSADEVAAVQLAVETGMDRSIFVHPNYAPYFLKYNAAAAWDFRTVLFASPPGEWAGANWPGAVEYSNGRVYYSGTPNEKNRFWASRSGSPFDLTLATGPVVDGTATPLPGDALDFKVATNGAILWLCGNRQMLAGTDLGECSISGSQGVPLAGDTHVIPESWFGSCPVQAVNAGAHALYISPDRRKVRSLSYDLQTKGWESEDLTFAAEHITFDLVKELHHTFTPESTVILLMQSGKLILGTFEPNVSNVVDSNYKGASKVLAWWRLTPTSGAVRSAAVSRGPQGAFLWMAVERGGAMYLERLALSEGAAPLTYVDAAVSFGAVVKGAPLALPHLPDGTPVYVIVDGALYPRQVVAGGSTVCPGDGAAAVVGIPYRATARTLNLEGGNPAGTSQGFKVHYPEISARLNNSARPLIQGTRGELQEKTFGAGVVYSPEDLLTADVRVKQTKDVAGGVITLEQDLPFRTEICAVYSHAQINHI